MRLQFQLDMSSKGPLLGDNNSKLFEFHSAVIKGEYSFFPLKCFSPNNKNHRLFVEINLGCLCSDKLISRTDVRCQQMRGLPLKSMLYN